jgi:arsenite methyltransferase
MNQQQADETRQQVRDAYSVVAEASDSGGCCGEASSCCGVSDDSKINQLISTRLGYSQSDLDSVPTGADMGLGCGNPRAIASLQAGHVVLDLGSGGGFDAFLAAQEVGDEGRVIGVDMTPAMISKARGNASKGNFGNVEFRLGEIEYLPVADASIDVIISNCVINLSPDKPQVFREAHRVLRPGGRLAVSDIVTRVELPQDIKEDLGAWAGCVSGAWVDRDYLAAIEAAGFVDVRIEAKDLDEELIADGAAQLGLQIDPAAAKSIVYSARVTASKSN